MNTDSKNPSSSQSDVLPTSRLFDDWIDPIESGVRARVRDWIEALVHSELDAALQRPRYGRSTGGETEPAVAPVRGYRNGSRTRTLTGTFGKTDITVPRARLQGADGATTEWKSKALRAYQPKLKAATERLGTLRTPEGDATVTRVIGHFSSVRCAVPRKDSLPSDRQKNRHTQHGKVWREKTSASRVLAALASSPATKALDPDPFPRHSLRHAVYAALLHFGFETADKKDI